MAPKPQLDCVLNPVYNEKRKNSSHRPASNGLANSQQWQLWEVVVLSPPLQRGSCLLLRLRRTSRQKRSWTPSFHHGSGVKGESSGCSVCQAPQPPGWMWSTSRSSWIQDCSSGRPGRLEYALSGGSSTHSALVSIHSVLLLEMFCCHDHGSSTWRLALEYVRTKALMGRSRGQTFHLLGASMGKLLTINACILSEVCVC